MQAMQAQEQAPAEQYLVEPGLAGSRQVDEKNNQVEDHVDRQVSVKEAQGCHPAPRPSLEFGLVRNFANARAGQHRDRLAALTSHGLPLHTILRLPDWARESLN